MEEVVKLKVTDDNFIRKYIQLRTLNLLTGKEYDVLTEIARKGGKIGREEKAEIREKLNMSVHSLNNLVMGLKKQRILSHDLVLKEYTLMLSIPVRLDKLIFEFKFI